MIDNINNILDILDKRLDEIHTTLDKKLEEKRENKMSIDPKYDKFPRRVEDETQQRIKKSNEAYIKWVTNQNPKPLRPPLQQEDIDKYLEWRRKEIYDKMASYSKRNKKELVNNRVPPKNEVDPNGLSIHSSGAKVDKGKPDLDLVLGDFSRALVEVSKVGTFGADKYSRSGWIEVPNGIRRYSSALLRHMFYWKQDELVDEDSKLSHLSHAAWNALAILELTLREEQNEKDKISKLDTEGNCI